MKEKGEKRRTGIFLCEQHRKALEQHYYLDALEDAERWGSCFGCMKTAWGRVYDFEPRRKRYLTARAGGGERARAGR